MTTKHKLTFGAVFAAIWMSAASLAYAQDSTGHEVHPTPPGQAHEVHPKPPGPDHPAAGGKEHEPATPDTNHGANATPTAHGSATAHGTTPTGHGDAHGAAGHGAAGGHGEAHGAGAHHGPESINWTDISNTKKPAFVALIVNVGILVSLFYLLGRKPIAAGLKQRRVTIGKDIEEAQKMLDEAKGRAEKYQADLKNVDVDAATAKSALVAAGKGEAERVIEEAQERADRMKRDADRLVDQERKQLVVDLQRDTVELAVKEAVKLLEKGVTADDHQRLANDLLAELAKRPSARSSGSVAPPRSGGQSGSVLPPRGAS